MHKRWKLSRAYLADIGLVVTTWAKLEWLTHYMVWRYAELEPGLTGPMFTAELGSRGLLDALKAAARHYAVFDSEFINEYCAAFQECAAIRNRVAHGLWQHNIPKGAGTRHMSAKGSVVDKFYPTSRDDLKEFAKHLSGLCDVAEMALRREPHRVPGQHKTLLKRQLVPRLPRPESHNPKKAKFARQQTASHG